MNKFRKEKLHKTNEEIRFPEVRVIGDFEPRVMSSYEASQLALSEGKDLILINENAKPPIVRIDDYHRYLYEIERKQKEQKKKQVKIETKEIQLSTNIAEHDLGVKARKALEFLEEGDKVKCVLQMKGREKAMPEKGELVMYKFCKLVESVGLPEAMPKLEGGRWLMVIKTKKK